METVRTVVETLITLIQTEVIEHAVLVPIDDVFTVSEPPALIIQGPTLRENRCRRSQAFMVCKDLVAMTYEKRPLPRLYHLDFDVVIVTANEPDLLDLQERVTRFFTDYPVIHIEERGRLNLTEQVPLGGLRRVNLSNLKQCAGTLRLEDCPIFGNRVETGPLILDRRFEFRGDLTEIREFSDHLRSQT